MAPVWWGLDLGEIQWSKFKSSYMWNNVYHLRRTKFIVYQIAMIFCVVSESLGTAALSDYIDQQSEINRRYPGAGVSEQNNDYVGIASFNIFSGIYVAFVFGGAFFFDLIWPERREDKGIRIAWKVCSVLTIFTTLATAIAMTIIVATHSAVISGPVDQAAAIEAQLRSEGRYPLVYKDNGRAVASLVFVWPGWLACIASVVIMWLSINYTERYGPWSTHERVARGLTNKDAEAGRDWNQEMLQDPKRGGGPSQAASSAAVARPSAERTYTGT